MAHPVVQMDFAKKSLIVITGASKGIGQTIAIELSKHVNPASTIVLLARTLVGLQETKNKIAQVDQSIAVLTYQIDLSKPDLTNYNELIDEVLASVDISDLELGCIFHNAGHVGVVLETTQLLDLETWRKYFDLNLFSAVLLNSAFVLKLEKLIPQLVVVNITSLVGRVPFSNMSMYGSGKASREIFFKVLALEKPKLIVLNYSPGPVSTDMFNSICDGAQNAAVREQFQEVRNTNVLTTTQTVEKLLDILKRGTFKSGDTIDYFDRF